MAQCRNEYIEKLILGAFKHREMRKMSGAWNLNRSLSTIETHADKAACERFARLSPRARSTILYKCVSHSCLFELE